MTEVLRSRLAIYSSVFRLVLLPALTLFVLSFLHLKTTMASYIVVVSGLPAASLNAIMAEKYDCKPQDTSFAVVGSTILCAVSVPILALITGGVIK